MLFGPFEITMKDSFAKGCETELEVEVSSDIESMVSKVIVLRPAMKAQWVLIAAKAIDYMNPKLEAKN
ncbi:hypothetical protein D5086_007573 [Populus alba]|uniref:Uncharacterized protein n=1 Tax=Populus alba TaxID=43335 RepID=A0ACC4CPZ7_POPAL